MLAVLVYTCVMRPIRRPFSSIFSPSLQAIAALRKETQASLSLCKRALAECNGELEKARDIVNRNLSSSAMLTQEDARNSSISIFSNNFGIGMTKISCRTDFGAKSEIIDRLHQSIFELKSLKGIPDDTSEIDLARKASQLLQEPVTSDQSLFWPNEGSIIFYHYIHQVRNVHFGSMGCVLKVSSSVEYPDLCQKLARHIAGCNPKDKYELLNQEFLYSYPEIKKLREIFTEHPGLQIEEFVRYSIN